MKPIPKGFLSTKQLIKKKGIELETFRKLVKTGYIPEWLKYKTGKGCYWNPGDIFWYLDFYNHLRIKNSQLSIEKIKARLPENQAKIIQEKGKSIAKGNKRYHDALVKMELRERNLPGNTPVMIVEVVSGGEMQELIFIGNEIEKVKQLLRAKEKLIVYEN